MTILADTDLNELIWSRGLIEPADPALVNPASVDIRIGDTYANQETLWKPQPIPPEGLLFAPGDFALVATLETFNVPNGYAMDLRLKSSSARAGWDHSLAFWVDPGWNGKLTMEIRNVLKLTRTDPGDLLLVPGTRFAQVIVHKLSQESARPYQGRYKHATTVEGAKK